MCGPKRRKVSYEEFARLARDQAGSKYLKLCLNLLNYLETYVAKKRLKLV